MFEFFNNFKGGTNNADPYFSSPVPDGFNLFGQKGNTSIADAATKAGEAGVGTQGGWLSGLFGGKDGFLGEGGPGRTLLGGAAILGNLWNSRNANRIAKDQLGFAKEQFNTNLALSKKAYNTALADRIRGRYSASERTDAQRQAEVDRHKL